MRAIAATLVVLLLSISCVSTGSGWEPGQGPQVSEDEIRTWVSDVLSLHEAVQEGGSPGLSMDTAVGPDGELICTATASGYRSPDSGNLLDGTLVTVMAVDDATSLLSRVESSVSMLINDESSLDLDYAYDLAAGCCTVTVCYVNGQPYDPAVVEGLILP